MHARLHQQKVPGGHMAVAEYGNPAAPTVLVMGGISGHKAVLGAAGTGWWQGLATVLPPTQFRLLAVDYAGGQGDTRVSPFPTTVEAQAHLIAAAIQPLLGDRPCLVVGGSYGGLLALAMLHQPWVCGAVVLAAAHRPTAWAVAYRYFQRQLYTLAAAQGEPAPAALARSMAMLSYRSTQALDEFYPDPERLLGYLEHKGKALQVTAPAAAEHFVTLFGPALDAFRIDPAHLTTPLLTISFDSDQLVPPSVVQELHERAPGSLDHLALSSHYGHDGFIKETATYGPKVRKFVGEVYEP